MALYYITWAVLGASQYSSATANNIHALVGISSPSTALASEN